MESYYMNMSKSDCFAADGHLGSCKKVGFPGGSDGKESTCNVGDLGSTPGLGRSPEGGHGNPLQYSCLENPHGQRSLASYSPWGSQRVRQNWATKQSSTERGGCHKSCCWEHSYTMRPSVHKYVYFCGKYPGVELLVIGSAYALLYRDTIKSFS